LNDKLTVNISARSVLVVFLVVALIYFANLLKGLIILFVLAYILAIALKPSVSWLKKMKVPRSIGTLLVLSSLGFVFVAMTLVFFPLLFAQLNNLYGNRFEILDSFRALMATLPGNLAEDINHYVDVLPQKIGAYLIGGDILNRAFGVLSSLGGLILFFVITSYIIIEDSTPMSLVKKYWPKKSANTAIESLKAFETKISQWVRGQIVLSVVVGVLTGVGLLILGVPYAALLAVIAAIAGLIPYIGPWISAFFGLVIAFTVSPIMAFWVAILYFGIQQLESAVLVPKVMKKAVGLSPVAILFVITSGVVVFGILGAVISIPIIAGTKAAIDAYLGKMNG